MTIGDNIGIGNAPEMNDNVAIALAAEIGGALDFVKDFPDTFDTIMSSRYTRSGFERNQRDLSGGQWQRLALSRTFMRISSADLLLLDEPSASLDPEAEFQLFKKLKELRRGRTTVYISHRFNTVRAATRIMVPSLPLVLNVSLMFVGY
jgi:ATP-binding cassette, subfamily B, bacterial